MVRLQPDYQYILNPARCPRHLAQPCPLITFHPFAPPDSAATNLTGCALRRRALRRPEQCSAGQARQRDRPGGDHQPDRAVITSHPGCAGIRGANTGVAYPALSHQHRGRGPEVAGRRRGG